MRSLCTIAFHLPTSLVVRVLHALSQTLWRHTQTPRFHWRLLLADLAIMSVREPTGHHLPVAYVWLASIKHQTRAAQRNDKQRQQLLEIE